MRLFDGSPESVHHMPALSDSKIPEQVIQLLERLIATPSYSREEEATGDLIETFLREQGLHPSRKGHNIWVRHPHWKDGRPVVLLNSHHDTVRPGAAWQHDPFTPSWEDDFLYGLGSNDAGGPLVSLIGAFLPPKGSH